MIEKPLDNVEASAGSRTPVETSSDKEISEIAERYSRRSAAASRELYSRLKPAVYMSEQEKERKLIRWITKVGLPPLANKQLLEIGCGSGGNLIDMIRFGFAPENLVGNDLLEKRANEARRRLPSSTKVLVGDAAKLDFGAERFDVVYLSTVFSSILDANFQTVLAKKTWSLVKPGGYVLWYDFIYNNPKNDDVKGIPVQRVRQLFPLGEMGVRRITLAPPISRRVTELHPRMYDLFNLIPWLRTHVLCWIRKSPVN